MSLIDGLLGIDPRTRLMVGVGEPSAADMEGNEGLDLARVYVDARYECRYVLVDREEAEAAWRSGSPHTFVTLNEDAVIYVDKPMFETKETE